MFGALLISTLGIPPSTLGTEAGADIAVVFCLMKLFSSNYPEGNGLEPNMPMHEASSLGPVPVDNPLIADNKKRVLGDVIFTHPPSLVGANLPVNTHNLH